MSFATGGSVRVSVVVPRGHNHSTATASEGNLSTVAQSSEVVVGVDNNTAISALASMLPECALRTPIARVGWRVMRMLCEKNAAYGNSATEPLRVFSRASTTEQLRVRIDDKLSRLMRGNAAGEDTIMDLLGYMVLLVVAEEDGQ